MNFSYKLQYLKRYIYSLFLSPFFSFHKLVLPIIITVFLLSMGIPFRAESSLRCEQILRSAPLPAKDRGPSTLENFEPATSVNEKGEWIISPQAAFYSNQAVDLKKFRAPLLVSQTPQTIIINNFLHGNKFYELEIDLSSIENVYVQSLPFPVLPGVIAGHVQARFTFLENSQPKLKRILTEDNQWVDFVPDSIITSENLIKDLVVSYEAALPEGTSYNFLIGAVNANPLVGRVLSGEQKHSEGPDRQVIQYRLPLNQEEKKILLERYLTDATKIQMNLYYNTVIRNCTTQIFDGIDTLPRIQAMIRQNQIVPFLTNIGGDPVIGPARKALVQRFGSALVKVQDLNDERAGIYTEEAVTLPSNSHGRRFSFAPGGENPMNLLVVMDNYEHLSPVEKAKLAKIRNEITESLPDTFNLLLSASASMGQNIETGSSVLKNLMHVISRKFRERVIKHQLELPEKPVEIKILFTPYPSRQATTPLIDRGLRAELPFPVTNLDLNDRSRLDFFHTLKRGIDEVEAHSDKNLPLFLKTTGIHLILSRSQSVVHSQFLFGLQPLNVSQHIENDQLRIDKLTLPEAPAQSRWQNFLSTLQGPSKTPRSRLVTLLVDHQQSLFSDQPEDTVKAQFGHNPLIASRHQGLSSFLLSPETENRYFCFAGRYPHGPRFSGHLSHRPLGQNSWMNKIINRILSHKPVTLTITHLDFSLSKLELESVRVRVGTLGLRCVEIQSVNDQFRGEANSMLKELISKLGQNPVPLNELIP